MVKGIRKRDGVLRRNSAPKMVHGPSLARSKVVKSGQPKVASKDGFTRVRHREFIGTVRSNGTNYTALIDLAMNPGLPMNDLGGSTATWLSRQAKNYNFYRWSNLRVEYKPACATVTPGSLMLAVEHDSCDASPLDVEDLMRFPGVMTIPYWKEASIAFPALDRGKWLRVVSEVPDRDDSSFAERLMCIPFTLWIGGTPTGVTVGTELGRVYVDYDVELKVPARVEPSDILALYSPVQPTPMQNLKDAWSEVKPYLAAVYDGIWKLDYKQLAKDWLKANIDFAIKYVSITPATFDSSCDWVISKRTLRFNSPFCGKLTFTMEAMEDIVAPVMSVSTKNDQAIRSLMQARCVEDSTSSSTKVVNFTMIGDIQRGAEYELTTEYAWQAGAHPAQITRAFMPRDLVLAEVLSMEGITMMQPRQFRAIASGPAGPLVLATFEGTSLRTGDSFDPQTGVLAVTGVSYALLRTDAKASDITQITGCSEVAHWTTPVGTTYLMELPENQALSIEVTHTVVTDVTCECMVGTIADKLASRFVA